MRRHGPNPFAGAFRLAVGAGILVNLGFLLPALFAPYGMLAWLRLPRGGETIWIRAAGGMLLLLSLLYVPAAIDPFRYRANAALLVVGRIISGVFWFWMVLFYDAPRGLLVLAYVETAVGLLQVLAYVLMLRHEYLHPDLPEEAPGTHPAAVPAGPVA